MKRLLLVLLIAVMAGGCVSGSSQIAADTAPGLYDGNRFIGKVMSFDGSNMTVWIPNMKALVFYSWVDGMAALSADSSDVLFGYESDNCEGSPVLVGKLEKFSVIVSRCVTQEIFSGNHCRTYYIDGRYQAPQIVIKSVDLKSYCAAIGPDDSVGLYHLQDSDIPALIKNPEMR